MHIGYYEIVCIISIFQLSLFCFFLFGRKRREKIGNRILGTFLLAQALGVFDLLVFQQADVLYSSFPSLFFVGFPFRFLWAPTLYFYVRSLTSSDFRFKKRDALHLLPFMTALLILLFSYHLHSTDFKRAAIIRFLGASPSYTLWISAATHIQIMSYVTASLFVLHRFRSRLRNMYSSLHKINLSWLNLVLYGYVLSWFSSLVIFHHQLTQGPSLEFLRDVNMTAFLIFYNIIFYKGLTHPLIFLEPDKRNRQDRPPRLSDEISEGYVSRLRRAMEEDRVFLQSDLTLKDLAGFLEISPRHLSQVINDRMRKNFFDFINHYRVEEAKKLLLSPEYKNLTILAVAYDSGFNSKSTFHEAFRKFVRMTPSQFRKSMEGKTHDE